MGQQSRRTRAAKLPPAFYKRQTCRQRYWKGKIRCTTENPNRCIQEWVAIKPAVTLLAPEVFCVQFNTERGVPNGSVQLWTPIWAAEYVDFVSNEARVSMPEEQQQYHFPTCAVQQIFLSAAIVLAVLQVYVSTAVDTVPSRSSRRYICGLLRFSAVTELPKKLRLDSITVNVVERSLRVSQC